LRKELVLFVKQKLCLIDQRRNESCFYFEDANLGFFSERILNFEG
jgi:hypothetical protein